MAEPPPFIVEVFFWKPSTLATLSSILKYRFAWELKDRALTYGSVMTIHEAMVGTQGSVTRGECNEGDLFVPSVGGIRCASVGGRELSIRELARLVLASGLSPSKAIQHQLDVQVDEVSDMDPWLQEVWC